MRRNTVTLFWVLGAAFAVKLPFFSLPLIGYFGSYQVVNAMMAEMMGQGSAINVFTPRTFLLMNGAHGLHLLYYPFSSLAAFLLDSIFDVGIPWCGRLQSGVFMLGATFFFYKVAYRFLDRSKVLLAVFLFSFSPMILLSGVSFQNEAVALFFLMLSCYLLDAKSTAVIFLSGLIFSLSLTARIHFGVALPAFLLWINREKFLGVRTIAFLSGTLLPIGGWIAWIYWLELRYPLHIQTSLFSQLGEGRILMGSIFSSMDFYRRTLSILMAQWGAWLLFPLAILASFRMRRKMLVPIVWLWGSLLLIVFLPRKVIDHPFYLIVGTPALAILATLALEGAWSRWRVFFRAIFCMAFLCIAFRYYLPPVLFFSDYDQHIPLIGSAVQKMTSADDKIIVQGRSSGGVLFYAHRTGWGLSSPESREIARQSSQPYHIAMMKDGYGNPVVYFETLRKEGAKYFVASEPDRTGPDDATVLDYVRKRYKSQIIPGSAVFFDLSA